MKRIKDFTKVIGIVGRGGNFHPSNEAMTDKWNLIFSAQGLKPQVFVDQAGLRWFRDRATEMGYKLLVITRGINR